MVKAVFKSTAGNKKKMDFAVHFPVGETIFTEGELGTEMFIIQQGAVEILKQFRGEDQELAELGQGDFFGEMSILEDLPRTATARAKTDCKVLRINGTTFDSMLRKNPEIAVRMMRKLSRRLRDTDNLLRKALGSEESQVPEIPKMDDRESAKGPEQLVDEASGIVFRLAAGSETQIGRRDPVTGINPDIDLTPADTQRSISRRHAKIFRRGEKFFLREEIGTMNGTFINGERVETGVPVEFHDGDELRFGLIRTKFHLKPE
ncbi:MAG: cyclic nucleotide-binding domain-containing protein [Thermoanaerobaculia bacterium]|nr:cyclic nucleotide-binding domain-containing protein [Thermoanaerobaculia bacterium]